jgi:perosamine synthetase
MSSNVQALAVSVNLSLREALEKIDKNAQGIAFIVGEDFKLVGVLTDGDVRRGLLRGERLESPVSQVMNREFKSFPESSSKSELSAILENPRYSHIPLLNEEGVLVDFATKDTWQNIPVMEPYMNGNELAYVSDCVRTKWISSQGKYVSKFEEIFSELHSGIRSLAVGNGTVALHLAIVALGIGPGDEVIVPDLTFAASANSVLHAGAIPVLVDVLPDTWCIDPEAIRRAITPKTKAIMPVHLYGQPCNMDAIEAIAKEHGLFIIEDAAEAMGTLYKGKPVGTFGDASAFSFFGNKMVTTGEGGMVTFKDESVFKRGLMLRDHGMSREKRYWHLEVGFNYRMTNLQAAIGVAQLEQFDEILNRKLALAESYSSVLAKIPGLQLPPKTEGDRNVCWLYTILVDEKYFGKRDELIFKLLANGIESRPVFYPLHQMPPYKEYARGTDFKNSIDISRRGISLPSSAWLSEVEVSRIAGSLKKVFEVKALFAQGAKV